LLLNVCKRHAERLKCCNGGNISGLGVIWLFVLVQRDNIAIVVVDRRRLQALASVREWRLRFVARIRGK